MSKELEDRRMGHLVRTAEVWKRLVELGATEATELDFDFQFSAKNRGAVSALKLELSDYSLQVSSAGLLRKSFAISGSSGPICWTEGQLLQWVDYLIYVASETGCQFEGCGTRAPA